MKDKNRKPKTYDERKESTCLVKGIGDSFSCDEVHCLLANKFNDSGSAVHGTSTETNRTHPVSV